ncbi:DUF4489 domain-containing protein [Clostridium sp. AL.422]|uniref:DUF4489 domain-containing protein n=1 Tax=Clostridium TaxID=1485 RepID=UPI00293DB77E|nr:MULTISPECIES: DUF4489 domain-containing protein [unclassified Clostridium]MDV4149248.1 DUF4489 domain-containing protein [Clostridium sp. AL.422]
MTDNVEAINKYCNYDKNNNIYCVGGNCKTSIINLPISQNEEKKSCIIDAININTSSCSDYKVRIDYVINVFKESGIIISNMNFHVYKICEGVNYKIPVNTNLFYSNNTLSKSIDLLNLTVYDDGFCGSKKCVYLLEVII